jgi:hypothetical protein
VKGDDARVVLRPSLGQFIRAYRRQMSGLGGVSLLWICFAALSAAAAPREAVTSVFVLAAVAGLALFLAGCRVTVTERLICDRRWFRTIRVPRTDVDRVVHVQVHSRTVMQPLDCFLVIDSRGRCVARLGTSWWVEDGIYRAARVGGLAIVEEDSWSAAALSERDPGSVAWWLVHPWWFTWVGAVAFFGAMVALIIVGNALLRTGR